MGKVGEFLDTLVDDLCFVIEQISQLLRAIVSTKSHAMKRMTQKNDETICRVDSFNNSSSDSSLNDVHLQDDGNILTTHNFTGLSTSRTDKVLDWMVMVAGSQFMFFNLDYSYYLDRHWYYI